MMSETVKRTALFCLLILLIIIASPMLFPLVIGGVIASCISNTQFKQRYKRFLEAYDDLMFFCYSDRRNRHTWVEQHILPHLDPSLNVIFVQGIEPHSDFDPRCISQMLDNVSNGGCPNLIMISNGQVIDISLDRALQEVFSGKSNIDSFLGVVDEKTSKLAGMAIAA